MAQALDHHLSGAAAEHHGQLVDLRLGKEPPAGILARVADLTEHPQCGVDLRHRRVAVQQADDALENGVVTGHPLGRTLLVPRTGGQRQQVRERRRGQPGAQVHPGQIVGQHPDQRVDPGAAGDGEEVAGHGAVSDVDDGQLAAAFSRAIPIMVSMADQPDSVPPATSTRSMSQASDIAYQCFCPS